MSFKMFFISNNTSKDQPQTREQFEPHLYPILTRYFLTLTYIVKSQSAMVYISSLQSCGKRKEIYFKETLDFCL